MSHIEQQTYCNKVKDIFPEFFENKLVVDIGSLDINGNNHGLFFNCMYIGVDIGQGNNVDFISKGHELNLPDNSIDTIISTECFEHDMYYERTLRNIYRMLKPGGLFIFTCATTGRAEHGTRRTTPQDAILLQEDVEWSDYYKNLTENDIAKIFNLTHEFKEFKFEVNEKSHDLYFYGFKTGEYVARDNYSFLMDNVINNNYSYMQIFYATETEEFEENTSIRSAFFQHKHVVQFKIDKSGVKKLRFDPLDKPCKVKINSIVITSSDGRELPSSYHTVDGCVLDGYTIFYDEDPRVLIDLSSVEFNPINVSISIDYFNLTKNDVIYYKDVKLRELNLQIQESEAHYLESKRNFQELQQQSQAVLNSISWKITMPLRGVDNLFRKFL